MSSIISLLQQAAGRGQEKISVIIPCYNREQTIAECLDSIFAQTLPMEMLEIIVVDDGSTDSTSAILQQYREKYPEQIRLVSSDVPSNGFVGKVRNLGMSYATGEYLSFVDSDDYLEPSMLEKLYIKAVLYNADVVDCGYRAFLPDRSTYGMSNKVERLFHPYDDPEERKLLFMNAGVEGSVWGKLYLKSFLTAHEIKFPEDQHIAEDSLFHGKTLFELNNYYVIAEPLYHYRLNPNGIWNSGKASDFIEEAFLCQERLYEIYCAKDFRYIEKEFSWSVYGAVLGMKVKCAEIGQQEVFHRHFPVIREKLSKMFPNLKDNTYIYEDAREINSELLRDLFQEV